MPIQLLFLITEWQFLFSRFLQFCTRYKAIIIFVYSIVINFFFIYFRYTAILHLLRYHSYLLVPLLAVSFGNGENPLPFKADNIFLGRARQNEKSIYRTRRRRPFARRAGERSCVMYSACRKISAFVPPDSSLSPLSSFLVVVLARARACRFSSPSLILRRWRCCRASRCTCAPDRRAIW